MPYNTSTWYYSYVTVIVEETSNLIGQTLETLVNYQTNNQSYVLYQNTFRIKSSVSESLVLREI